MKKLLLNNKCHPYCNQKTTIKKLILNKVKSFKNRIISNNATNNNVLLEHFRKLFSDYNTSNLVNISNDEFKSKIDFYLSEYDARTNLEDESNEFDWGHDHDFGDFQIKGKMADRHIIKLAYFCKLFDINKEYFNNKKVFDIGCWTGGTTLMLCALGANVFAIDTRSKAIEMASFLKDSFGLSEKIKFENRSIYNFNDEKYYDEFDLIYYPGVIYHVSDPVISLRLLYNTCKINGTILIETAGIINDQPLIKFVPGYNKEPKYNHDSKHWEYSRRQWSWFVPSASALYNLIYEAGWREIKVKQTGHKIYAYARKTDFVKIRRDGLSFTEIK